MGARVGLGVVLNPAAAKLGTKLLLGCCGGMNDFVGFSVSGNSPTIIFPANDGLTFLPKSCCFFGGLVIPVVLGTSGIELGPKIASAVLLRFPPLDPGQPSHPS